MKTCKLVILFLSLFTSFSGAWGQPTKLNVSYSSESPGALPVWMAKETGIYVKNGLDVQLIRVTGNVAVMALISGDVGIGLIGGSPVITSNLGGSDAVLVAAGQTSSDYALVSQAKIKTAAQLKGGILGVASHIGVAMTVTQYALQKLGLNTGRDVTFIVVGGMPERLIALRTGRIQATLLSPPQSFEAEKDGFSILMGKVELLLPYNSVATTRRFIKENPDIVRKFIKSHVETVHLLKTDRGTGVKVLAKYLRQTTDRDLLERSYDLSVADGILPRKQYPTLTGIKTVLDTLLGTHPKASTAKPEDFVDMRFIKELDESGYIDNLYKGKRG